MYQEVLIKEIQQKIGKNISIIDEVAKVLNISYDASHRRISVKSKFSIEETILLCEYYKISMDSLFLKEETLLVQKTKEISTFKELALYFEDSLSNLKEYKAEKETTLYYSAKDIPLFYTIESGILSKFKLYVWLNLLNSEQNQIRFEEFTLGSSIQEPTLGLKSFYENITSNEIWNDTTINSTLQQILYFFQSGLLSGNNAVMICESLKELIFLIEEKCNPNNETLKLYYHELLILNNNVLISDSKKNSLFVPYTMLGYFITDDKKTCNNTLDFFKNQMKNSVFLNQSGTRDKKIFFNKMYQKIEFYKSQIDLNKKNKTLIVK